MDEWNFKQDAELFIWKMLLDMKELLPYGNLKNNSMNDPPPPESFKVLYYISCYHPIARPQGFEKHSFSSVFTQVNNHFSFLGTWVTWIDCFIKYWQACIQYVEDPRNSSNLASDEKLHSYTTRPTTDASTWKSYAKEWKDALLRWTEFCDMIQLAYSFIHQIYTVELNGNVAQNGFVEENYARAIITIINKSASSENFWYHFWNSLVLSRLDSGHEYTKFFHLLNKRIVPALIDPNYGWDVRTVQMGYCRQALQKNVDALENYSMVGGIFFDRDCVRDALRLTGITLMPDESLIGDETRLIATNKDKHEMAIHNNWVYYHK